MQKARDELPFQRWQTIALYRLQTMSGRERIVKTVNSCWWLVAAIFVVFHVVGAANWPGTNVNYLVSMDVSTQPCYTQSPLTYWLGLEETINTNARQAIELQALSLDSKLMRKVEGLYETLYSLLLLMGFSFVFAEDLVKILREDTPTRQLLNDQLHLTYVLGGFWLAYVMGCRGSPVAIAY